MNQLARQQGGLGARVADCFPWPATVRSGTAPPARRTAARARRGAAEAARAGRNAGRRRIGRGGQGSCPPPRIGTPRSAAGGAAGRLFRRMLDAGRTLQGKEEDERKERQSTTATDDSVHLPRPSGHDCWATTIACECRRGKSCSSSPPRSAGSWWTTSGVFRRRDDDSRPDEPAGRHVRRPFRWPHSRRPSPAPSSWSGAASTARPRSLPRRTHGKPADPAALLVSSACWFPSTGPANFCRKSGRRRPAHRKAVSSTAWRSGPGPRPTSPTACAPWPCGGPSWPRRTRRRIGSGERRRWAWVIVGALGPRRGRERLQRRDAPLATAGTAGDHGRRLLPCAA